MNNRYIDAIAGLLQPDNRGRLLDRYRSRSYPLVYPDTVDPIALYSLVVERSELSPELTLTIEQMWAAYRAKYQRLCDQMERASDRWHRQLASGGSLEGWQLHNQRMGEWTVERQAAHEEIVRKIRTLLPEQTMNDLGKEFANWDHRLERLRAYQRTVNRDSPDSR